MMSLNLVDVVMCVVLLDDDLKRKGEKEERRGWENFSLR